MGEPDRPGPDADASEIAMWMEEDFEQSLDEGMIDALRKKRQEKSADQGDED